MDPALLRYFVIEIRQHCRNVEISDDLLGQALQLSGHRSDHIWYAIGGFLNSSANISKLFWSSGQGAKNAEATRSTLRTLFSIKDDSPLASRKLRDDFEHHDERLEEWFAAQNGSGQKLQTRVTAPRGEIKPEPVCFQRFYPDELLVANNYSGNTVYLKEIWIECARLITIADEFLAKP